MTMNLTARPHCLPLGRAEWRGARGLQAAAPTSGGLIYCGYTLYREAIRFIDRNRLFKVLGAD
jgi:hypothetical protein